MTRLANIAASKGGCTLKGLLKGFRVAKIFGIDIELHWTILLMFALIAWDYTGTLSREVGGQSAASYWIYGLIISFTVFLSVIIHEFAHSLVARKFSMRVSKITLFIFGGAAQGAGNPKTPKAELWYISAGPASSLLLGGLFLLAWLSAGSLPQLAQTSLKWLFIINIALAVFNIFPIFPMDGGRILRAVCWYKTKDMVKSTKIALDTAVITGIALTTAIVFLFGLFSAIWIGLILWFFIIPAGTSEYYFLLREKNNEPH